MAPPLLDSVEPEDMDEDYTPVPARYDMISEWLNEKHTQNYIFYNFGTVTLQALTSATFDQVIDYPFDQDVLPLKNLILCVTEMQQWLQKSEEHILVYNESSLGQFVVSCLIRTLTEKSQPFQKDLFTSQICNWFVQKCSGKALVNSAQTTYFDYYEKVMTQGFNPGETVPLRF